MANFFFNIPVPREETDVAATAGTEEQLPPSAGVGVFTSPQSIVSFPVAAGLVSSTWKVLGQVWPFHLPLRACDVARGFAGSNSRLARRTFGDDPLTAAESYPSPLESPVR
jgi:hypothetical protein